MSGLTSTGFERERLADIKTTIEDSLKTAFGSNIDLEAESAFGQFVGILSEAIADQWEEMENVYNSQYPSTASGAALSNVVLLNGIERISATHSIGTITITGTVGTTIPTGSQVSTSDTGDIFLTDEEVVIGGGGTVDVGVTASETGPIPAAIGTLTEIDTPVFGWTSVTNTAAIIEGRNEETDAELRIRRKASTQAFGGNQQDALAAQLLNLDDVIDALVISNRTGSTDSNGIPAHEFMCVVYGGAEQDILDVIWDNTPQGIQSYGTSSGTVTDSQGFDQTVYYTDPTPVPIYFTLDIVTNSDFPVDGGQQIQDAIEAYGSANFLINDTVKLYKFFTPINTIPGIDSYTLYIGTSASPSGTSNITIDVDEIPTFDGSNVDINYV